MKTVIMDFIKVVNGEFWMGDPHSFFERVSCDTRKLKKGDCFFALSGPRFDGHDFIKDAVEKNASVIVFSRADIKLGKEKFVLGLPALIKVKDTLDALVDFAAYQRSIFSGKVIAIGGSNGKTTTKNMLHSILSLAGPTLKSYGNYNNEIGVSLTIFELKGDEDYLILELGISKTGEMTKLSRISAPVVALLTNIGLEHLEGLRTIDGVYEEEIKIFDFLKPNGTAVVNADDPYLKNFSLSGVKCLKYGIKSAAEISASEIKNISDGIGFKIKYGQSEFPVNMKIIGEFNVMNALSAAAVAYALGIEPDMVKLGLENFSPTPGRMEKIVLPNGCILINDAYNANPSSMLVSLKTFCDTFMRKNKILVLGDMLDLGGASVEEHEKLGEYVHSMPFDYVFLYGTEMAHAYGRMQKIHKTQQVKYFTDKEDLFKELKKEKYKTPETAILFKASHAVGFEELCVKIAEEL